MNSLYPETISLEGEKLAFLVAHSGLLETLYDNQGNQGPLELSADLLFPIDTEKEQQEKWALFYDLFFPEEGISKLFLVSGNTVKMNESRGGKEALREMLDYLMVDSPKTMMNFAKAQARKQINAPSAYVSTAPRAKGKMSLSNYRHMNGKYNNDYNNNLYYNYNNNNNSNNTKIGYTEEEEKYLGKLPGTLAQQYYRNQRRASNRRTRKQNRKSRTTRRNRK